MHLAARHMRGGVGPFGLMLFLAWLACISFFVPAFADTTPVAVDARLEADAAQTRIVFRLSAPVEANAFVLDAPARAIIDLPRVHFQLDRDTGRKGSGLVKAFRFGLFSQDRSRIVLDLAGPAAVKSVETVRLPGGAARLVVILVPDHPAAFAKAAAHVRNAMPQAKLEAPEAVPVLRPSSGAKKTIVIDPGHGGIDPGARAANGMDEKDIVFAFARQLREALQATGRYNVLLTREADVFVSLGGRVKFARDSGADIFVSIHADTLAQHQGVRGATVYTGSERATDAEAARLAENENKADATAGIDSREERDDGVGDILADLTRRETRAFSRQAANRLVDGMRGSVILNKNPQRSAGFRVLSAPDMPSVLIELGYLSSPRDVEELTSQTWRERASASIVQAIGRFFEDRATGMLSVTGSEERP